jgi:hypothetical protein
MNRSRYNIRRRIINKKEKKRWGTKSKGEGK